MPNIKFNYLYRDVGNYKNFNSTILENDQSISLKDLESLIKSKLIDGEWFYVDQLKLPDLHFGTWDNEIDHTFHEFESVEYTDEPGNAAFALTEFVGILKSL
jgi:aryl-phospho-beta-D-glucosidase BglC (GH1 family)